MEIDLITKFAEQTTVTILDARIRPDSRKLLTVDGKVIVVDTGEFYDTLAFATLGKDKTGLHYLKYTPFHTQSRVMGEFLIAHRELYSPLRRLPGECAIVEYYPEFLIKGMKPILGPIYLDSLVQYEPRLGDQLASMIRERRADFGDVDITFFLRIYCIPPNEKLLGTINERETFGPIALEVGKYFVNLAAEKYREFDNGKNL